MGEQLNARYARLAMDEEALEVESEDEIRILDQDVGIDLLTQAERYMHWARLATLAESDYRFLESKLKQVYQDCKNQARDRLRSSGEKITEDRVKELAELDPAYIKQTELTLQSWRVWKSFADIEQAFDQRCKMLQSLNNRQCRELGFYKLDAETHSQIQSEHAENLEKMKERVRQLSKRS